MNKSEKSDRECIMSTAWELGFQQEEAESIETKKKAGDIFESGEIQSDRYHDDSKTVGELVPNRFTVL